MVPTICRQDLLEIEPYGKRTQQVGDVIVFSPPGDKQAVVHRIIKLSPSGIRTRGDSNAGADQYLLQQGDITGRVVATWRINQRQKIKGGRMALFRVNLSRRWQIIDTLICDLLYPLYTMPARIGIFHRLLPSLLQPRLVDFKAGRRHQLRLFLGRHLIGHYEDNLNRWIIRRPFRLFVDERHLPSPHDFDR